MLKNIPIMLTKINKGLNNFQQIRQNRLGLNRSISLISRENLSKPFKKKKEET
jgi:hypothetical protein